MTKYEIIPMSIGLVAIVLMLTYRVLSDLNIL